MISKFTWVFALALLIYFPISILRWHHADTLPSSLDETRHMQLAMDYRAFLTQGVPLTNEWSHAYPPLYHLSIIPAMSWGMPSETKAAMTHVVYLAIFIAGCLLLVRSLGFPEWQGVLGAVLCMSYVTVFDGSRHAMIDFPLMAWTTLVIALLARTQGFSSRRDSFIFGAACGIGFLLKAPFVAFIVLPLAWTFFTSRDAHKLRNALTALGICLLISFPWYFWQSCYFINAASHLSSMVTSSVADPRTLAGWLFYVKEFKPQMGMASLVVTGIGVLLCLVRRQTKGTALLFLWFLSGYFCLSLLMNKDMRHTMPYLPALAILAIRGWGMLIPATWGPLLVFLAAPGVMLWNMSHNILPAKEDWKIVPIITQLQQRHDQAQPMILASVLSGHAFFFARTFTWAAFQRGIPLKQVSPGDSDASFLEFIIRKPGYQGTEAGIIDAQWQELHPEQRAFKALFSESARFQLPDATDAIVYRREPHPQFKVSPLSRGELERRITLAMQRWLKGAVKVTVEATPAGLQEGRLDRVRISCASCEIKGAHVQNVDVIAEKPWLNLYRLWDENRLGLLSFESLKPVLEVTAKDLQVRLSDVKGLSDLEVEFEAQKIKLHGRFKGIPVYVTAHVVVDTSRYARLEAVVDWVSVAHIPLPGWCFGKAHRQPLWLYPIPNFPGWILVNHVTIDHGVLQVS